MGNEKYLEIEVMIKKKIKMKKRSEKNGR